MDFIDRITDLAARIPKQLEYCQTEEATKNALIMPFINALGYDVFNPTEVVPEFTADIGTKKGEKVDYAVMRDGKPIILFECKWSGADLSNEYASQLFRYFSAVPDVRFGVLTNGLVYHFYSDLDAPNRMDDKPFFRFDMMDFQDRHVNELKKFTKSAFDLDSILTTASELKYTAAIRKIISQEFDKPSDDFVSFVGKQVYSGRMTHSVREQFAEFTQKAMRRFLNDQINERLKSALAETDRLGEAPPVVEADKPSEEDTDLDKSVVRYDKARGIMTTEDEIEAFFAVKSILLDHIDPKRVHMRDTKSYCGILLDDNNRKPICRLHFNREQKYVGLFDQEKNEERVAIDEIDDLYQYADRIKATVSWYDSQFGIPAPAEPAPEIETSKPGPDTRFTGTQVQAIVWRGERQPVDSWRSAMMVVLEKLRSEDPARFAEMAPTMVGRKRPHISQNSGQLRQPFRIANTDLYVEGNVGAQMITKLCYSLAEKMGFPAHMLVFEVYS